MKQVLLVPVTALLLGACGNRVASSQQFAKNTAQAPLHLELELDSLEYRALLNRHSTFADSERPDKLDDIVRYGGRLLSWLAFLNANRPQPLELTSEATQIGYPIEEPRISNVQITEGLWTELEERLPYLFKSIIIEGGPFADLGDLSDEEFVAYAREIDAIYQRASRWILQEPNLYLYAARSSQDVRGYYYLGKIENLEATLKTNWSSNSEASRIRSHLVMMCVNGGSTRKQCQSSLGAYEKAHGEVFGFYNKHVKASRKLWDSYFEMSGLRSDITWNDGSTTIPFRDPKNEPIKRWLTANIEDEWRFGKWQLRLQFKPTGGADMTRIEFVPGSTPHVNGIGGSIITMDDNQPLEGYNSRWTIRHEYGHVLGFPDCYVEFFDRESGEMISYQLDITNLMCSRRGHLQEQHYTRMKSAYGR